MPLTTRYGYGDIGLANAGDPSQGFSTLSASLSAIATTAAITSVADFPSVVEFDVIIGLRGSTGTWTNVERAHCTSVSGSTFTLTRPNPVAHAAGERISNDLTEDGLAQNPGVRTDTGDLQYLAATGRMARLAAGADRTFLTYASGVPVVRAIQAADLPDLSGTYLTPAAAAAAYQPLGSYAAASHTHTASQVTDLATAAVAFTNKTGAISQWTNDSGYLTAASALAGSSTTQVLFNNAGVIGGSANLTYDGSILLNSQISTDPTAVDVTGFDARITANPSADTGASYRGFLAIVQTAPGLTFDLTTHWIQGGSFNAWHRGSSHVDEVRGFNSDAMVFGGVGATVNQLEGNTVYFYNEGTIVDSRAIHIIIDNSGGGNWGVLRGIAIDDMAGFTASSIHPINYADKFIVDSAGATTTAGLTIGANLVTLAGAFTTAGANALTLTTAGATNVTLPTSGTLLTSADLATYVVGPASSVDNAIARFDSTTGKLLQGYTSGAPTIGDTGEVVLNESLKVRLGGVTGCRIGFLSGIPGIWFYGAGDAPSFSNYSFLHDGSKTILNDATNVSFRISNADHLVITSGVLTVSDAKNVALGTTTGTKIGTATTQKLAFYNATPISQGASIADASGGAIIDAEARTALNALISRIEATGLIATV